MPVAKSAVAATIVNCIGEQTTITGEGVTGATQLWPQQLGVLLGAAYTVNNDGVNAGSVVAGTAKSATSLAGPPNIVIIGPFAEHDYAAGITEATWQADYKKLVDAYLALTPAPTVYVMTPPPAAFVYQMGALEQNFATMVVKPAVLAVAAGDNSAAKTLKVIDLFSDATLVTAADVVGDGHFSAAGHAEVAQLAYKCVAMGMCGAATTTGTGGAGGGGAGAGGAGGAGGKGGAGGAGGIGGAGGMTTAGSAGSIGTAGAGGAGGATSGAAGVTGGTAGAGGATSGASGTGGGTSGAAGASGGTSGAPGTAGAGAEAGTGGGTTTGTAGTGTPARSSSGGGCAVGGGRSVGAPAGLFVAMALAARAWRRRRRDR